VSPARRLPLFTLALVAAAIASDASPLLSSWFVFDRASIESGQLWRVFTGHLVHELPELALPDLFVLALLSGWVELRARGLFIKVLAGSALVSSCAILFLTDFERYLGSSALACGLFAAAVVLVHDAGRQKLAAAAGLLLVSKLVLESFGYSPAGLGGLPAGFEPVLAAHAGGAVAGALTALATRRVQGGSASEHIRSHADPEGSPSFRRFTRQARQGAALTPLEPDALVEGVAQEGAAAR